MEQVPAILLTNKQYGRVKDKGDKFYYKCIPNDKDLPNCLVPFSKIIEFNKKNSNYYVIIKLNELSERTEFARNQRFLQEQRTGTLLETIGGVSDYESFCKYRLHCKSLVNGMGKFNKFVHNQLNKSNETIDPIEILSNDESIEDREDLKVYTIDPATSKDYDDAFSISYDYELKRSTISIYISNVVLMADVLKLWPYFKKDMCPATIYLNKSLYSEAGSTFVENGSRAYQPMIPKSLSENLCSLKEGETRFAFTMDIVVDDNGKIVSGPKFFNSKIKVAKNMSYDDANSVQSKDYKILERLVKKMNKSTKLLETIFDSHDVVAYIMILMNSMAAKELQSDNDGDDLGVFRVVDKKVYMVQDVSKNIPLELKNFLQIWESNGANYRIQSKENTKQNMGHKILNLESYVHITSPIRRVVDILNIIALQKKLKIYESEESFKFYQEQVSNIDEINKKFKSIKKVQNECELLRLSLSNNSKKMYKGYVVSENSNDKHNKNNNHDYVIYIPEIKMVTNLVTQTDLPMDLEYEFKIYTFEDENSFKRKVRISLCNLV